MASIGALLPEGPKGRMRPTPNSEGDEAIEVTAAIAINGKIAPRNPASKLGRRAADFHASLVP